MPRWRVARARARLPATRNNLFLSLPRTPSMLFLNRGFTWPRVCPAVITCIMRGAVRLRKKRLIDGPRRRGVAERSPPSSVGPGGARRRGENAFAEQTGRRDVNWNDGNSAIYFLSSFFASSAPLLPLLLPPERPLEGSWTPPFNMRSSSARQIPRHRSREENSPIAGRLRRVNTRVH